LIIGIATLGSVNSIDLPTTTTVVMHLENVSLQGDIAIVLASFIQSSRITNVFLHGFNLSQEGARALATALSLSNISFLNIRLDEESLRLIIPSFGSMPNIQFLVLGSYLPFSRVSCLDLFHSIRNTNVTYVSFWNITTDACRVISQFLPTSHLSELKIVNSHFDHESVAALIKSVMASNIQFLNLSDNNLDDRSAHMIANHLKLSNLRSLVLNNNNITLNGFGALVNASKYCVRLYRLVLERNLVNDEFAKAMMQVKRRSLELFC
jgi:hypothetical protein